MVFDRLGQARYSMFHSMKRFHPAKMRLPTWQMVILSIFVVFLFYGTRWFFGRLMLPNDFYIHYTWATFFAHRLASGCLMPIWLPEVFHGLGAAVFLYYPPLYFYGVGVLSLFLENTWLSMRIVELAAVLGMAWLAMTHVKRNLRGNLADCMLAVCTVACSPTLLARLYVVGGIPAFVSCLFMTGMAVRTAMVIQEEKHGWDWPLTFLAGALCWTHNLVILMAMAAIFGGLACLAVFRRRVPYCAVTGSVLLGFLLGFPRYVAAFLGMPSINHQNIVELEELLWQNNFVLLFGLKTSWALFQWGIGGLLTFGVCLWIACLLAKRLRPSDSHVFWLGGALTCLFFALPMSWPFWAWLPPLQYFQAPTRFLEPLGLFVALGLFCALREAGASRIGWGFRLTLWLFVALSTAIVGRVWQLGVPVPPHLPSWLHHTSNQWEYLPAGQPLGWRNLPEIQSQTIVHMPDGDVNVQSRGKDGGLVAELQQSGEGFRLLPLFHHACWEVYVDGRKTPCQKDGETGLVQIMVPGGNHHVETKWEQGFSHTLSGGSLMVLLLGVPVAGIWFDRRRTPSRPSKGSRV